METRKELFPTDAFITTTTMPPYQHKKTSGPLLLYPVFLPFCNYLNNCPSPTEVRFALKAIPCQQVLLCLDSVVVFAYSDANAKNKSTVPPLKSFPGYLPNFILFVDTPLCLSVVCTDCFGPAIDMTSREQVCKRQLIGIYVLTKVKG